mgnify:FL=1
MKGALSVLGVVVAVVVAITGLAWVVQGNDFFLYKVFAPKYESVRREVFEQSKAYNQGMVQELQNMQFEYVKASPEHQKALRAIILHRAADYNIDDPRVPADLRQFVAGLRREQSQAR